MAAQAAFGEPVIYFPAGGTPIGFAPGGAPLTGIFDEHAKVETVGTDGLTVLEDRTVLGMRAASFASPPAQGDTLMLRGAVWRVSEVRADGMGDMRFVLGKT